MHDYCTDERLERDDGEARDELDATRRLIFSRAAATARRALAFTSRREML